jgi:hypothetical protein
MFWSARENLGGAVHFLFALERLLLLRKREHYINALLKRNAAQADTLELQPLKNLQGEALCCRFCGFGILSMTVHAQSGSYSMSCCSTQAKDYVLKSAKLKEFLQDMPNCKQSALTCLEPG